MLRRQLLSLAIGAGAMACAEAAPIAPAAPRARARTTPATSHDVLTTYPPIAPLGAEVFAERRARAREIARDMGGDAMVAVSGSTSFAYLTGADFGRSERLIALVLPVNEGATLVAPSFEVERVKRRARGIPVRGWEESADPIAAVREVIGAAHTILIEPHVDYAIGLAIARAVKGSTVEDGTKLFEDLRVAKSDDELVRMRRAIAITEDAIAATFDRLQIGMTEREIARVVREEDARRGVEGGALVQLGANAALPHGTPGDARLEEGMVVLIDGGCSFQGYQSDITRTRFFGAPTDRFRALYDLVHDAQTEAIARVKPGVPAEEIDRAARRVIAAGGHAANFTHRLGHGIGMDGHEPVYMVEGNTRTLSPGYVFSVEPGIYVDGEIGVRLEDDVVCTKDGAEIMSRRAPRL